MAAIPRAQIEMLNLSSEEVCSVNAELRPFRWIYFYAGPNGVWCSASKVRLHARGGTDLNLCKDAKLLLTFLGGA